MTKSTTATYENDLEIAECVVKEIVNFQGIQNDDRYQVQDGINDALNNEWFDGIDVNQWAKSAAKRLGYSK